MNHSKILLYPVVLFYRTRGTILSYNLTHIHNGYRLYSNRQPRRQSFISRIYDNFKEEMAKNKEMKESLKKFRDEAEKLEQSEALKAARQKFQSVEMEASKGSEVLKGKLTSIRGRMQDVIEEASKTDIARKAGKITEDLSKSVSSSISETSQQIGKSGAFQSISQATSAVKQEIEESHGIHGRVYQSPGKLRKRKEIDLDAENKAYEPNTEALGVELHKDSKFYQSWQNFKDTNQYVHKVLDWKLQYEESNNALIRASRALTDKVSDIVGGLFQKTELSETLTEICKIDQSFEQKKFLRDCETDIIPNILEAMTRGDLEILRDWCHDAPYNLFAVPVKEAMKKGYRIDSKVLDIDGVDLVMGKVMDQGPVLIITFQSQQIMCVRDRDNNIVEGDPEKVMRVTYVWVLCRDTAEPNPRAAWRLLDISASSSEQLV